MKTGTLVDATIIVSASEDDDVGHWVKHKGKAAVHGFKAHVGADAHTAVVEEVVIIPANVNDGRAGPAALPDGPGEMFADSAYRGLYFRDAIQAKGGRPRSKPRDDGSLPSWDLVILVFGYQNHISIDQGVGFIRKFTARDTAAYEGARLREGLLNKTDAAASYGRTSPIVGGQ